MMPPLKVAVDDAVNALDTCILPDTLTLPEPTVMSPLVTVIPFAAEISPDTEAVLDTVTGPEN